MDKWYTVKVKYVKTLENGTIKRVSEPYLLNAVGFSDAEARIYEEMGQVIRGEFEVTAIAVKELQDIFAYDDSFTWWEVKVSFESGENGKQVSQLFMVSAEDAKEAYNRVQESLSTMLVEFEVGKIIKSPIVDIFPPSENLDREISHQLLEDENN